jgi:uncharacterized protein (TIGR02147 family)
MPAMRRPYDPDVFAYLDYREYLGAFYRVRKESSAYSYRSFSRAAKLKSPNYLKLVIDGERSLTAEMAVRFGAACGLDGEAAQFFVELVRFSQARTLDERNDSYGKLGKFRRYRAVHTLRIADDAYHSKWYIPAIRELVLHKDFREDPNWIAEQLLPHIKPAEAKHGLEILRQLNLIVRDEDGKLRQGTPLVSTGPEAHHLHVANFHRSMIAHAVSSLDRIVPSERDISSLTLCLNDRGLAMVKAAIVKFRRELLAMSELEADPTQVVQINFQLFPLSVGVHDPSTGDAE